MGILNQWLSKLFNARRPIDDYKINAYRDIYQIKYYLLAVFLVLAALGSLQVGLMDPIALIARSFIIAVYPAMDYFPGFLYLKQPIYNGGIFIAAIFIAVILANRFITRFWCRVLCPLGALLGVLSRWAPLQIRRDVEKCTDCKKCLKNCHGGCDPHAEVRFAECHLCMNCIEDCPEDALHYGLARETSSRQKPIDINRRRLVESVVVGAALFPLFRASLGAQSNPEKRAIRPPGSIPEKDFLRRCIKCGECMRVCPTNVLQPALLETGFEGLWTPIMFNKIGYCEFNCVLCGQVCPTGAIKPLSIEKKVGRPPYKEPMKTGTAFYDRGRCLPWAMNTQCIVCEEVCPTSPKAIWFKEVTVQRRDGGEVKLKRPHVDPTKCIGCGICENKCPVQDYAAIRVTSIGETRSRSNQMILK